MFKFLFRKYIKRMDLKEKRIVIKINEAQYLNVSLLAIYDELEFLNENTLKVDIET